MHDRAPGTRYYCVHVSTKATREQGTALRWSDAFDRPVHARMHGEELLAKGLASLAFVVEYLPDGTWQALPDFTRPQPARRTMRHYCDLLDQLNRMPPA